MRLIVDREQFPFEYKSLVTMLMRSEGRNVRRTEIRDLTEPNNILVSTCTRPTVWEPHTLYLAFIPSLGRQPLDSGLSSRRANR